ncbi:unnamed protein product [Boreogadus saida]
MKYHFSPRDDGIRGKNASIPLVEGDSGHRCSVLNIHSGEASNKNKVKKTSDSGQKNPAHPGGTELAAQRSPRPSAEQLGGGVTAHPVSPSPPLRRYGGVTSGGSGLR